MAQAFEGALVALQRVTQERAADCADEVARHRCVWRAATVVRAVVLAGRSRRRAAPPRAAAPPQLVPRAQCVLTRKTGGFARSSWLLNCVSETKALLAEQRAGCARACASRGLASRALGGGFLRRARGIQSRPCAAGQTRSRQGARFDRPSLRCAPGSLAHGSALQKGAQENAGKENNDGTAPLPRLSRRACTDQHRLTDATERPARGRRGRPQPDTSGADAEPAVAEPAALAQTGLAERAEPQASAEAVPADAEVRCALSHAVTAASSAAHFRALLLPACAQLVVDMACDKEPAPPAALACPAGAAQEQVCMRLTAFPLRRFSASHRLSPRSAASPAVRSGDGAAAESASQVSRRSPCSCSRIAAGGCGSQPRIAGQYRAGRQPGAGASAMVAACALLRSVAWKPQAPAVEAPPVVKQSGKSLALQAAELARKQEVRFRATGDAWEAHRRCLMTPQQRIHDERQAKKAELERQREAARRIAMQQPPSVLQKEIAAPDTSAVPPLAAGSAALPAAGKSTAPVLPARLQQAMQVRMLGCSVATNTDFWGHRRTSSLPRRTAAMLRRSCFSPRKPSARRVKAVPRQLRLATDAQRQVEESNARAEELRAAAARPPAAAARSVCMTITAHCVSHTTCAVCAASRRRRHRRLLQRRLPRWFLPHRLRRLKLLPPLPLQPLLRHRKPRPRRCLWWWLRQSCSRMRSRRTRAVRTGANALPRAVCSICLVADRCASCSDEEAAERPRKPVPAWARRCVCSTSLHHRCCVANCFLRLPAMLWHRSCMRKPRQTRTRSSRTRRRRAGVLCACTLARAVLQSSLGAVPVFAALMRFSNALATRSATSAGEAARATGRRTS